MSHERQDSSAIAWEGFSPREKIELQRLWREGPSPGSFASHFIVTVAKRSAGKPGMLSIEAKDLDFFRGHFSVLIVDDSSLDRQVCFVKAAILRFLSSFQHRNSASFGTATHERPSRSSQASSPEVQGIRRMRTVEEILIAEYHAAEAEFDLAKEAQRTDYQARTTCERYFEATLRMRKFLEHGEVPADVARQLAADDARQFSTPGMTTTR
jgi:hypothetical protein